MMKIVEGSLRDQLNANDGLSSQGQCIELLISWGASESDAQTYTSVIFSGEKRWQRSPKDEATCQRWLAEEKVMDRVEAVCLQYLCDLENGVTRCANEDVSN